MNDCSCPDWKPNIEAINGPIVLQSIRSGFTYQYRGKKFKYCPWCGEELRYVQPTVDEQENKSC